MSTIGRKPKDLSDRKTKLFNFTCEDNELMKKVFAVAEREKKNVSETIIWALQEFVKEHYTGNFQTILRSYLPEGKRSNGQIRNDIKLAVKEQGLTEIRYKEILQILREKGIEGVDIPKHAEIIAKELSEQGVKVYR